MKEENIQHILKSPKTKWLSVIHFYVVSIDMDGSGADDLTDRHKSMVSMYKKYMKYLVDNGLTGTVTIREAWVEGLDADPYLNEPSVFFDACDWDKMPVLHSKTYSPRSMKSGAEITAQIQRIFKNHGNHRLYDRALSLAMCYNERITSTPENSFYYENWRMTEYNPEKKQEAAAWKRKLQNTKYHRSLYTGSGR